MSQAAGHLTLPGCHRTCISLDQQLRLHAQTPSLLVHCIQAGLEASTQSWKSPAGDYKTTNEITGWRLQNKAMSS